MFFVWNNISIEVYIYKYILRCFFLDIFILWYKFLRKNYLVCYKRLRLENKVELFFVVDNSIY